MKTTIVFSAVLAAMFACHSWSEAAITFSPGDPGSIRRGIATAYQSGLKKVVVPPGVYTVDATDGADLRLADMNDFEIDLRGVTLLFPHSNHSSVELYHCRNVAFRGATLLKKTVPFTQGTIKALAPDRTWCELEIARGYPANFDDRAFFPAEPTGYVFDPHTRQWKPGTYDYGVKRMTRLAASRFRLEFHGPLNAPVEVGDEMAFRGQSGADFRVVDCAGMKIVEVTVRSGGGFVFQEYDGEGGNYYRSCKVTYGPPPAGASEPPLIGCNADAFHNNGTRKGPTLENCFFEGMPDDGVAIHGFYAMAYEGDGPQIVVAFPGDRCFIRPGDPVRLLDADGQLAGDAVMVACEPKPGYVPRRASADQHFKSKTRFFQMTIDRPMKVAMGWRISAPRSNGSGYVVRNCTIRNHRARGMLLKADDGLVEGNTIDGSTIAGIVVSPEFWWNEACYSRNVTLRGNLIRRVGYATTGPWNVQAGAISILGEGRNFGVVPGHRNIVIEGNTVENCDGTNLLIASARNVVVRNNIFKSAQRRPTDRGKDCGIDPAALVWLSNCRDVRLEGNLVEDWGPAGKTLVHTTPTAKVNGAESGVRRAK